MELFFKSFGVNVVSLVWFLVLFGIVLYLLRRYAFGPILGSIERRQAQINESLDRAEEAARSVDESRRRAEQVIQEASDHAAEIIRRAERGAGDIQDHAREEARIQAELIVTRARQDIDRESAAALAEIRAHVVDLALFAANKVIEANLDAQRNRKLIEEAIVEAELVHPTPGPSS
jgi:F-type H+-transporting ATPase subunit b